MLALKISKIPDKYIIERWRKKERKCTARIENTATNENSSVLRFNVLSRRMADMASKASKRKDTYLYMLDQMDKLDGNLDLLLEEGDQNLPHDGNSTIEEAIGQQANQETLNEEEEEEEEIEDPDLANTKGKKSARTKGIVEKLKEVPKRHCTRCGRTNHTIESCPLMQVAHMLQSQQQTKRTSKKFFLRLIFESVQL